jgi:hypothetical protein
MRDAPRSSRRSAACAVDDHPECPHLMGFKLAGEQLCCCPCHGDCRYAGTVSVTPEEWWDSCSCPGSEWMREEGRRRWGREKPPTLEEALRSAQADEARREIPLQPPLAPDASAFTAFKTLVRAARQARAQHKKFAVGVSGTARPLEGPRGQPPYLVEKDYSLPMADVVLEPWAAAILEQLGNGGIVWLERDPEARVAVFGPAAARDAQQRGWRPVPACAGRRPAKRPIPDGVEQVQRAWRRRAAATGVPSRDPVTLR